jgi:hypothetical protein
VQKAKSASGHSDLISEEGTAGLRDQDMKDKDDDALQDADDCKRVLNMVRAITPAQLKDEINSQRPSDAARTCDCAHTPEIADEAAVKPF